MRYVMASKVFNVAHIRHLFILAVVLGLSVQFASAQNDVWNGGTSSDWDTATNWNLGIPTNGENVYLNHATTNPLVLSTGETATVVNVYDGQGAANVSGVIDITGGSLTATTEISLGHDTSATTTGTLDLTSGSVTTPTMYVGNSGGPSSFLMSGGTASIANLIIAATTATTAGSYVTLTGGTLTSTSTVTVGHAASATLTIGGTATFDSTANNNAIRMLNSSALVISGSQAAINLGTSSGGEALDGTTGGTYTFNLGQSGLSTVNILGSNTFNLVSGETLNVNGAGFTGSAGTYVLFQNASGSLVTTAGQTFSSTNISGFSTNFTPAVVYANNAIELVLSAPAAIAAYFNGVGNDINTAGDFDSSVSGGQANGNVAISSTNLFFSANRNTSTMPNLSAVLTVNSVNFGTGSGTNSGITVSSSNASDILTIEAGNANGNTAGNGITVSSGSDTISAPVALGASQSWTTAAGTSLAVSGQISDGGNAFALTKAGTGALTITNNNIYTGGTTIGAGTFYANNAGGSTISNVTSSGQTVTATNAAGSATGTGAVTVQSTGILAGSGTISGPVTVLAGGTLSSGAAQTNAQSPTNPTGVDTVTGTGLTLTSSLAINDGSSLSFALGAGPSTGPLNFASPNLNSTYLSFTGNTAGEINFGIGTSGITINLVDLTAYQAVGADTLGLRIQNPYLLMAAGSDSDYANLITTGGLDQNGYVLGVGTTGAYTAVNFAVYNSNGQLISNANNYENLQLYLYNGDLEVVPEPGTWSLMLSGLALLVVIQRRRRSNN